MGFLDNKTILITGGTGSFGKKFLEYVYKNHKPKKLIVFSRDELKQFEMKSSGFDDANIRYFLGDVRDLERLKMAFENVDIVVHAAALKQVPAAEYNPMEFIKTNVLGAENVIQAALQTGVKNVVALSTDKAAAPINLYGATKLCSDKLFVAGNNIRGWHDIKFSVVRYGNVMGSRGSVIPFFMEKSKSKTLPITDASMTRFNISLDDGIKLVLYAIENAWGGEIFVPKIPSYKILDVANAVSPSCKIEYTGIRPGEKIHEEMITESDSYNTYDVGKYYVILPQVPVWNVDEFKKKFNAKKVSEGFRYASNTNDEWMTVDNIRDEIKKNINPDFIPE
ncbi:MAG TPA: UDP-N-acetylglucosamine 4,6-dehydratase (inverting) [Ignavibacteria bacterium]|nr:UDP-N-acetylglucosamine 4,6-dehydratase (inverting) [Ignavibacteria bacterium]